VGDLITHNSQLDFITFKHGKTMKLLEHQAKRILKKVGLPVPAGMVIETVEQVSGALDELGFTSGVLKTQVYAGERGRTGGIRFFKTVAEAERLAGEMLHRRTASGENDGSLVLEEVCAVKKEMYAAITLEREKPGHVVVLCREGGRRIADIAASHPDRILRFYPALKKRIPMDTARKSATFLGLPAGVIAQWHEMLHTLYQIYILRDCLLLEINPLALTEQGGLVLLDCKMEIDDNALFRQRIQGVEPYAELSRAERAVKRDGMSYVKMDGNIGCVANGAGMAMATVDALHACGGKAANFLDVGGSASPEAIGRAFDTVCSHPAVKGILVNIFGGITRCDNITQGIIDHMKLQRRTLPLVVRLEGTRAQEGRKMIEASGITVHTAETIEEGAEKIVGFVLK
jgi:succinyl-CoA synthetase beta subunit